MLTAAQLLQQRGTLLCQTPMRLHKAVEGESTAKAWVAITLIGANKPSVCFQALSISSWRQKASIRCQTRSSSGKGGRHKTQGVWQQLNPPIRNRLLLLLSADGQTEGDRKAQKAVPEREMISSHYIKKLLTDIHWRLHPSWTSLPITNFTC